MFADRLDHVVENVVGELGEGRSWMWLFSIEVVDYLLNEGRRGLICKLNMEKVFVFLLR